MSASGPSGPIVIIAVRDFFSCLFGTLVNVNHWTLLQ